jgi:ribosome-associated toxin RatA of RatAB toxin-antitoxin module
MKTVHKSVLIWYSAQQMFDLVADVPKYPLFLPWCDHALVLSHEPDGVVAEIGISMAGVRQKFTTRNTHEPGKSITMRLIEGPFSRLRGQWTFDSLDNAETGLAQKGSEPGSCRVDLRLQYGFGNPMLATLVGPVFDKISSQLVDAFVKRAEQVYG